MASTTALLAAATFTLFSSALAFSPDQCNITAYGAPTASACTTLLASISKLGVGNASYLFIPSQFPTPDGVNGTRKEFPQSWSTTGCNAALVPQEYDLSADYDNSSSPDNGTGVTYDTSTYAALASRGSTVVQHCVDNTTAKNAGGWVTAGDYYELVLHIYATGSQIDTTIKMQNKTDIAATSEDEVDAADADDPNPDDGGDDYDGADDGIDALLGNSTTNATTSGADTGDTTSGDTSGGTSSGSAAPASSSASVVKTSSTFNYIACEADSTTSRTLSSLSWSGTNLTVERCAAYCSEYKYMGVEFGSQCYCGGDANGKGVKTATSVTSTQNQCTTPCNGDATQICGGVNWLSLYQNTQEAEAGATA